MCMVKVMNELKNEIEEMKKNGKRKFHFQFLWVFQRYDIPMFKSIISTFAELLDGTTKTNHTIS